MGALSTSSSASRCACASRYRSAKARSHPSPHAGSSKARACDRPGRTEGGGELLGIGAFVDGRWIAIRLMVQGETLMVALTS